MDNIRHFVEPEAKVREKAAQLIAEHISRQIEVVKASREGYAVVPWFASDQERIDTLKALSEGPHGVMVKAMISAAWPALVSKVSKLD